MNDSDDTTIRNGRDTGLSRRELLGYGAAAGAAAAFAVGGSTRAAATPREGIELEEATIADLQGAMSDGRLTAVALTSAYLGRIAALDGRLASVIETNPDALEIAAALDDERASTGARGPLHGIPVLVKDNIATADRMETTAGSLALLGAKPPADAAVAARLRAAGAVILGKTNLSEWANFRSTRSSSGWSGRGGQCRNPYALDRSPCGSSSGTGASIAANLAAVGVGTETDGSIVCPSGMCSLVGLKPTVGLVGRSGIVPISHTQDTAGPMARTVRDAAVLLTALAAVDPADPATSAADRPAPVDYTSFLAADGLAGARIGVARTRFFGYSPEADGLADAAIAAMKEAGADIVDPADIPNLDKLDDPEFTVLLYEFKADLEAYLRWLGPTAPAKTLADLIRRNEELRDTELRYFGQELFLMADKKGPLTDDAYVEALAACGRFSRAEGLDVVFREHRLDAIVAPTGSPPWTIDLVNGDHFLGASSTPAAVSGYPSITVPAGYAFGLPVGLTFIGQRWGEGTLLRLAYAYEQRTRMRRPPRLPATADLD